MEKVIKTQEIKIDGTNFHIKYIVPDDMYIITPYTDNENIKNKLFEELKLNKEFKTTTSNPVKTKDTSSIANVEKALIISKPNN